MVAGGECGCGVVDVTEGIVSGDFFVFLYLDCSGGYTVLYMGSIGRMKLQKMITHPHTHLRGHEIGSVVQLTTLYQCYFLVLKLYCFEGL